MASISLARVDDRLIHGQVVIKWFRLFPADEILIYDDQVRADPFLQRVLALAAPPAARLTVKSVAETIAYLGPNGDAGDRPRVLLLVRSPKTALQLLEGGVSFAALNVGGMAAGPGTRRLHKSISATPEQIAQLEAIARRGVRVFFQTVPEPEETPVEFEAIRRRYESDGTAVTAAVPRAAGGTAR